jgi:hypothetical protein
MVLRDYVMVVCKCDQYTKLEALVSMLISSSAAPSSSSSSSYIGSMQDWCAVQVQSGKSQSVVRSVVLPVLVMDSSQTAQRLAADILQALEHAQQ